MIQNILRRLLSGGIHFYSYKEQKAFEMSHEMNIGKHRAYNAFIF